MDLTNGKVSEYFQDNNLLSTLIDNYTYRSTQAELADHIFKTFSNQEVLVAEAGTGIGKTYAYLIPAVLWASDAGEQVVISTRTKALQEQLIAKDLPSITKALHRNLRVVEAKGRENYLCWHKYMEIISGHKAMNPAETEFMGKILTWAEKTRTGDKKELNLKSDLMNNWRIVAAERKTCAKEACLYHDKCFRLKMMRSLHQADIIVVNHALLFSDITVDNSILPPFKYLIIDEAHHIDKEAFTRLSNRVGFGEFHDILKSFYNKTYNKGYLPRLKKELPEENGVISECITLIMRINDLLTSFQAQLKTSLKPNNNEQTSTIIDTYLIENEFQAVYDLYFELIELVNRLIFQLASLKVEEADFIMLNSLLLDISDSLFKIMEEELTSDQNLVWVEWHGDEISSLVSSIINIGSTLNTELYAKLDSLVILSATLTIDDKFDFFVDKTGLNFVQKDDRLNTFLGPSPFTYEKQAKMFVLGDLPPPDSRHFTTEIIEVLKEIINTTKGQTLILFTARKQMLTCAKKLRPFCEENKIELLVQNEDGEASNIVNSFIANENSVLMGLDSFWEGIDLKGDILTCLVIIKLPFRAPSEPFTSAYEKHSRNQGLNSFRAFALPDAVMRFKQGIGRLIRSEKDKGIIIVLDNRLYTKNYGETFKRSIPIKNIYNIRKDQLAILMQKAFEPDTL